MDRRRADSGAVILRGGRVIAPATGVDAELDVACEQGRIKAVGKDLPTGAAREIDAAGKIVAPGFIDMHVHLREPGREDTETIATGTAAAAAGGFTAVAAMPNTTPPNDGRAVTEFILRRAAESGAVRVHPIGCVTRGLAGEELAEIGDLVAAGCVAVSDDGHPVASALVMRRALEYCRAFGIPVIDHCEEPSLAAGGVMHEGPVSTALGLRGAPAEAEEIMVERNIRLAEMTGGRIHIAHISTRRSVDSVRRARDRGVAVSVEVTPHHLLLTDESLRSYDTHCRMNPPLRPEADRLACVEGLMDGTISAIATDHAPHAPQEKNVEFDAAPNGIIGLETAVPVLLDRLVKTGALTLARLIEAFTRGPAEILKLEGQGTLAAGSLADVTVLDPAALCRIDATRFASRSGNTPFDGWQCVGRPVMTLVGGRVVFDATGEPGPGSE
ncbi:MAG: dihydroorotase [Acidobacteriota bacterium]